MGYPYEVTAWTEVSRNDWQEVQLYAGRSLFAAAKAMLRARRGGCMCIRFAWRG